LRENFIAASAALCTLRPLKILILVFRFPDFMKQERILFLLLIIAAFNISLPTALAGEREVSFKTEDGWTIYATLNLPDTSQGKVPVVILLPSTEHDRAAFEVYKDPGAGRPQYPGLAPVIRARGVGTLNLDLRGRGKSLGKKELHSFSTEELSKIYLDVQAAFTFLESQPEVDSFRIGIVAVGKSAESAVLGWGGDSRVSAMALISGRLSDKAKKQIAESPDLPLFVVVSSEDKEGFAAMTDAYFLSKSKEGGIEVFNGLGIGTWMFSLFRAKYPKEKPLHDQVGEWIANQVLLTGRLSEVSFQTEDGWTIYGNLRIPQVAPANKIPAVILLHSGLSDRHVYADLEVALARNGLAVLNIDWRGNGKSTGKGKYFELSKVERDKGYLDALAAVNFLASQTNIDVNRVGILGTVIGAKHAMAAAAEEPRIKTAVVLTGYIPTEKERAYFTNQKVPVLYVTSTGHGPVTRSLTEMYTLTKDKGSELITFSGGAIGYQLFKLEEDLLPRVVRWMKEKLSL
jgi:dienelactone hydrolase